MSFARFMSGPIGRGVRIVVGLLLLVVGVMRATGGSAGWWALAAVGLVVFLAGALNVCGIAPLIGAPFRGRGALASAPR